MKPSLLLPNRFKKIGLVLLSLGLLVWILTQKELIFTELDKTNKVITLTMSFFCFLFGLYFFTFSNFYGFFSGWIDCQFALSLFKITNFSHTCRTESCIKYDLLDRLFSLFITLRFGLNYGKKCITSSIA